MQGDVDKMNKSKISKIYIWCGNATYNRGDRGNLVAQLSLLQERFPGVDITINSYDPNQDAAWYGVRALQNGLIPSFTQLKEAKKADVIIWGGGALMADNSCRLIVPYWLVMIFIFKFVLRKPVMAWAHGVVLGTSMGRVISRLVYNWVDIITVRDQFSYDTLQKLGVKKEIHKTADPAILINPVNSLVGEDILKKEGIVLDKQPIIAISPTFWMFYHDSKDIIPFMYAKKMGWRTGRQQEQIEAYKQGLVDLVKRLKQEHSAQVLLIPRYPVEPWDDVKHLQEVAKRAGGEDVVVFESDDRPPKEYLAIFRCFDLVISTALHDAIFATALKVPCVQLYYEDKGRSFFEAMHADNRSLDWRHLFEQEGMDKVMSSVKYTMEHTDNIQREADVYLKKIRQAARSNLDYLERLII